MPITIPRPKHLDIPDEIVHDGKRVHIYEAHTNGKRLLESLIWLCAHYARVELTARPSPSCNEPDFCLMCSGNFMIPEEDEE